MSSNDLMTVACTVCLGAADGPMITAARVGVLVMAGCTTAMLTAFALFFLRIVRHSQAGDARLVAEEKGTA